MNKDLRCIRLHILKGSPSYCWRQLHVGIWLMTVHSAFLPHIPIQGLIHLLFMQALLNGQSEFCTHSGLHSRYGSPWYSLIHSQSPLLHIAFDPHGDGLHGSGGSGGPTIEYWDIFICEKQFFMDQSSKTHCKEVLNLLHIGTGTQLVNASPEYPLGHVQDGVWLITVQIAFVPQDPGHGFLHLFLIQALLPIQSELTEHSGWQLGGVPM